MRAAVAYRAVLEGVAHRLRCAPSTSAEAVVAQQSERAPRQAEIAPVEAGQDLVVAS
jgi:hypothetical protein